MTTPETTKPKIIVIMVPFPAQSHLNLLLQLAGVISSYDLPVHYMSLATHNRQVKTRANNVKSMSKIQFHNLHMPVIESPDPSPNLKDKLPHHLQPLLFAYMGLRQQIGTFVRELSVESSRTVLIYDRFSSEAVSDAVTIPNVEAYSFSCFSAFNMFRILWEVLENPFDVSGEVKDIDVPPVKELYPENIIDLVVSKPEHFRDRDGDIYNTSRLIEAKYIDLLARKELDGNRKHWAITPTFAAVKKSTDEREASRPTCLKWLDKQPPRSVIYVSFGTCTSLSDEEAKEIAFGLEQSKQKFLWVLREADVADIFAKEARKIGLPQGFEERVRENGLVLRDWAPQIEILGHKSIGGFMTHCGWNSCYESLSMGVPIAAWPMHSDQYHNAIYFTKFLNVGIAVREWDRREEMIKATEIKQAVECIIASEEGDKVRERAQEMSSQLHDYVKEGGELCREIESFIAHIAR